eukprot:s1727_g21.t1
MAPKKKKVPKEEESEYSYVTDEEAPREGGDSTRSRPGAAAASAAAAPAKASAPCAAAKATPTEPLSAAEETAAAPASETAARVTTVAAHGAPRAKARVPSPPSSSEEPGPTSPPQERSPRAVDAATGAALDTVPEPTDPPRRDRSSYVSRDPRGDVSPAKGSKGKHKGSGGRRTQQCPACWADVAWSQTGSGLSHLGEI